MIFYKKSVFWEKKIQKNTVFYTLPYFKYFCNRFMGHKNLQERDTKEKKPGGSFSGHYRQNDS